MMYDRFPVGGKRVRIDGAVAVVTIQFGLLRSVQLIGNGVLPH